MFSSIIHYAYGKLLQLLCILSPTLNNKVAYFIKNRKWPDLHNPKTFSEKLIFLKLKYYNHDPIIKTCADKYEVRKYLTENGYEYVLNDLYYVFDDVDSIDFTKLPEKFVLKWNFGAGYNIICRNRDELDFIKTKKQLKKWQKQKYHLYFGEMQYRGIKKKIVCERFLGDKKGKVPDDYKLFCFNGTVKAIFVMSGRGEELKTMFMTPEWEIIGNTDKYKNLETKEKPKCLKEMLQFAESVSQRFPFVRIDLFVVEDHFYFGEFTFTPAGGIYSSEHSIDGKNMGELLNIEVELKECI